VNNLNRGVANVQIVEKTSYPTGGERLLFYGFLAGIVISTRTAFEREESND